MIKITKETICRQTGASYPAIDKWFVVNDKSMLNENDVFECYDKYKIKQIKKLRNPK